MSDVFFRGWQVLATTGLVFAIQLNASAQIPRIDQPPFELEVVSSGRIDSSSVLEMMDMSLFNPGKSMQRNRQDFENEPREEKRRDGGFRSGGRGTVITGSSSSIGARRDANQPDPNYQIEVMLSRSRSKAPLADTIAYFHTEYELVDDLGNVIASNAQNGMYQAPGSEQTDHDNTRFLYVHVPDQAKFIKNIKGHVIVSGGYSFEAYVRADQLQGKVRKQAGDQFIEFETVDFQNNQLNMNVTFTIPPSRVKPFGNLREMQNRNIEKQMELTMWEQFNRMVVVIAKGDDGKIYKPSRLGSAGSGGQAGGDGTGGGTGSGTGGRIVGETGNPDAGRPPERGDRRSPGRRSSNVPRTQLTSGLAVAFEFGQGVKPVAVKCMVHQRTSEIEGIPFEITDIPVHDHKRRSGN